MTPARLVTNADLQLPDLPPVDADMQAYDDFALTFDGHGVWGR
jgi:hypothetical protein